MIWKNRYFDFYEYDSYKDFGKLVACLVIGAYGLVEWLGQKKKSKIRQKEFDEHLNKKREQELESKNTWNVNKVDKYNLSHFVYSCLFFI